MIIDQADDDKLLKTHTNMVLLNASSHRAQRVKEDQVGKIVPASFIVLEPKDIDPDYLAWHLNHDHYFKHQLQKAMQGSTISIINVQQIKELEIRLPDPNTQEMVGRMAKLTQRKEVLLKEKSMLTQKIIKYINQEGI